MIKRFFFLLTCWVVFVNLVCIVLPLFLLAEALGNEKETTNQTR